MQKKPMASAAKTSAELLNQWSKQRKSELRDDVIEYILSEPKLYSRKEILVNARILYLRSIRVAAHYNPWLRERCESILTQCEVELEGFIYSSNVNQNIEPSSKLFRVKCTPSKTST